MNNEIPLASSFSRALTRVRSKEIRGFIAFIDTLHKTREYARKRVETWLLICKQEAFLNKDVAVYIAKMVYRMGMEECPCTRADPLTGVVSKSCVLPADAQHWSPSHEWALACEMEAPWSLSYGEFIKCLPGERCRYLITNWQEDSPKTLLLCWWPDEAKIKDKMYYASQKSSFKKMLSKWIPISREISGTDLCEIDFECVNEKMVI